MSTLFSDGNFSNFPVIHNENKKKFHSVLGNLEGQRTPTQAIDLTALDFYG